MPKFIGNKIDGSRRLDEAAGLTPLTYAQAVRLPARCVFFTVNATDRGSRGSYAKRWHNWWARPGDIIDCPSSTPNMRGRALATLAQLMPTA